MISGNTLVKHFFGIGYRSLVSGILFLSLLPPSAMAKKRKKEAIKKETIAASEKNYKECRKSVLAAFKAKEFPKKALKGNLKACTEKYPGAKLYIDCKKKALKGASQKGARAAKVKLKACRELLRRSSYSSTDPFPFMIKDGKAYFAGIGMNLKMDATVERPNFNCHGLSQVAKNVDEPQYLFFGNKPSVFKGFSRSKFKKWRKEADRAEDNSFIIDQVGQIYPSGKEMLLYFPSGECYLKDTSSSIFEFLNIYYLINPLTKESFPFVALAKYKDDYKGITSKDLIRDFSKQMAGKAKKKKQRSKNILVWKKNQKI